MMIFDKIISHLCLYAPLCFLLIMFQMPVSVGAETTETLSSQWDKPREVGEQFLKMLSVKPFEDIRSISGFPMMFIWTCRPL